MRSHEVSGVSEPSQTGASAFAAMAASRPLLFRSFSPLEFLDCCFLWRNRKNTSPAISEWGCSWNCVYFHIIGVLISSVLIRYCVHYTVAPIVYKRSYCLRLVSGWTTPLRKRALLHPRYAEIFRITKSSCPSDMSQMKLKAYSKFDELSAESFTAAPFCSIGCLGPYFI